VPHASSTTDVPAELHEIAPAAPPPSAPSIVRVDMRRLDHLMTMVSDLVISRGHVEESLRRLEAILPASAWRQLQDANLLMQRQLRDLREGVMQVRMESVGQIFERMRFVIRGLERESHKDVRLELTGHDTEIDKLLVERMMDPLLHMVRNAVSHGLEPSKERIASGKTPEGHLRLHASTEADTVVIELEDDGRGVDVEQVANRARSLGLIEPGETPGKTMDSSRVLQMICAPGFSTREEADLGAGRGVGMTVVKTAISGLGGTLAMDTRPGKGTRFTIRLPLTLAIMQALIVSIDDQPFAVPRSAIREVLRVEKHAVMMQEHKEVIPYRAGVLPIVYLHRLFRMNGKSKDSFHVFVAGAALRAVGIAVDRIAGQREIVVRSLADPLVRVPGIAGATELGDGRPVLILDVAAIVDGIDS
jgi:two-component system, chemotaxis family, sensor kinase CheA